LCTISHHFIWRENGGISVSVSLDSYYIQPKSLYPDRDLPICKIALFDSCFSLVLESEDRKSSSLRYLVAYSPFLIATYEASNIVMMSAA
jgi:hypothetical protein